MHARVRAAALVLIVAAGLLSSVVPVGAAGGDVTTYPTNQWPGDLVAGPDGALWYPISGVGFGSGFGRVTTDGTVSTGPYALGSVGWGIAAGSDGNLWFASTSADTLCQVSTALDVLECFDDPAGQVDRPTALTTGPDGAIWFNSPGTGRIGRLEPTTGAIETFTGPDAPYDAAGLAPGPDGNVWFADQAHDRVGRIAPDGTITTFTAPSLLDPTRVTSGPDGNVWVADDQALWRVTPAGVLTRFETGLPGTVGSLLRSPLAITAGPDGALWFTSHSTHLGRLDPLTGATSVVTDDDLGGVEQWGGITAGPDGDVWFTSTRTGTVDPFVGSVDLDGPRLAVSVTTDGRTVTEGHPLAVTVEVRNVGDVALTGITVDEPRLTGCSGGLDDLAPGEVGSLDCIFTPTHDDLGWVVDVATVSTAELAPITSRSVATQVVPRASLTVTQAVDEVTVVAGHPVHYHLTVTNTGEADLTGVTVDDSQAPECDGAVADVAVGDQVVVDCAHTPGFADVGVYANTATVDTDQTPPVASNEVTTTVTAAPGLRARVKADATTAVAGTPLGLHVKVVNTGDVALTGVTVTSPVAPDCAGPAPDVPVGGQVVVDCGHTPVVADADHLVVGATVDTDETAPVAASPADVLVVAPPSGLPDVSASRWYALGVDWAVASGLVAPRPDGTYRPGDPVSRSQLVRTLWALVDRPEGAPATSFVDVPSDASYHAALDWAVAGHVLAGVGGTDRFRPRATVDRARLASALWSLVGQPGGSPVTAFPDVDPHAWYRPALDWAVAHDLLSPYPDGTIRPRGAVSRGALAGIVFRLTGDEAAWSAWAGPPPSTWRF